MDAPTTEGLTSLERDLLDELCQTRVTSSSVVLAEQLANRRGGFAFTADPYGMVAWTLHALNDRGLVAYTVGHHEVPVRIRVTRLGYAAMGYIHYSRQVGARPRSFDKDDPSRHPGDLTDFRNLIGMTWGGAVERLPLLAHVVKYPLHDHRSWLVEAAQKGENTMARPGVWTPEMELRALALRANGASYNGIAEQLGVTHPTVAAHLRQIEATSTIAALADEIATAGIRTHVLRLIGDAGRVTDAETLPGALARRGRPSGMHEVAHVLNALQKQDHVSFVRHQAGTTERFKNIELTASGHRLIANGDATPQARVTETLGPVTRPTAETEPTLSVESTPEPVPTPDLTPTGDGKYVDSGRWSILSSLLVREGAAAATRERVGKLNVTAIALDEIDPDAAELVRTRALEIDGTVEPLTDVEQEYLAFAKWVG